MFGPTWQKDDDGTIVKEYGGVHDDKERYDPRTGETTYERTWGNQTYTSSDGYDWEKKWDD